MNFLSLIFIWISLMTTHPIFCFPLGESEQIINSSSSSSSSSNYMNSLFDFSSLTDRFKTWSIGSKSISSETAIKSSEMKQEHQATSLNELIVQSESSSTSANEECCQSSLDHEVSSLMNDSQLQASNVQSVTLTKSSANTDQETIQERETDLASKTQFKCAVDTGVTKQNSEQEGNVFSSTKSIVVADDDAMNQAESESESKNIFETIRKSVSKVINTRSSDVTSSKTNEMNSIQDENKIIASEALATTRAENGRTEKTEVQAQNDTGLETIDTKSVVQSETENECKNIGISESTNENTTQGVNTIFEQAKCEPENTSMYEAIANNVSNVLSTSSSSDISQSTKEVKSFHEANVIPKSEPVPKKCEGNKNEERISEVQINGLSEGKYYETGSGIQVEGLECITSDKETNNTSSVFQSSSKKKETEIDSVNAAESEGSIIESISESVTSMSSTLISSSSTAESSVLVS